MNSCKNRPESVLRFTDEVLSEAFHPRTEGTAVDRISSILQETLPITGARIYLLSDEGDFQPIGNGSPGDREFAWVTELVEDGVIDWVIREKKVSPIPDRREGGNRTRHLIVPLIVRGRGIGFVAAEGEFKEGLLPEKESDLLVRLTSLAGLALENEVLAEKLERRNRRLDVLERISQKLLLITDLNQLLTFVLDYALEVVPSQEGALAWPGGTGDVLIVKRRGEKAGRPRVRLTQIEEWVIETGNPLILNDYPQDLRFRGDEHAFPFPLLRVLSAPIPSKGDASGALTLFNRREGQAYTNQDFVFLSTLATHAAVAIEIATLYRNMREGYKETIRALVNAIEAKDPYTRGHTERVTEYALRLAATLGMAPEEVEVLEYASLLHDVGKIGISGRILRKKGPLDEEEYREIKKHPAIGEGIVRDVRFLDRARLLIRAHHERYDGRGYPDGLNGRSVPLPAHILIVADALDAMASRRPYRRALSQEEVRDQLLKNVGKQFHPRVVEQAIRLFFRDGEDDKKEGSSREHPNDRKKKGKGPRATPSTRTGHTGNRRAAHSLGRTTRGARSGQPPCGPRSHRASSRTDSRFLPKPGCPSRCTT